MADRSVRLILKAEVADFKRQMAEAAAATDKIPASAAKAETSLGRMVQSARYNRESWDRAGQTMTAFGTATLAGLALAGRAAVNWESQWTGVLKTVNGTDAELSGLEEALREMARTLPASHQEIAAVAEAAGQLGVQTPNVAAFTRVMVDLGETTNLSADEAATALAQLMNVMQTSAGDVDNLGAAVVALGNNGASTERDIVLMAQRIAGAGKIIGLTEGEVLGMANALASVGIEVEAGGTAISKIMIDMAKAVSTGSDDLTRFAEVAGMSAEQFATAFEADPAAAIASFVEGLGRVDAAGGDVFTTLDSLGQSEVRVTRALLTMANSGDLLRDSLALGNTAWADNTALVAEAEKRYDTAAAKLEIAKNSVIDTAITLGQVFLPAIADAAEGVADFAQWVGGLPGPVQAAAGGIQALTGGLALTAGAFLLAVPRISDTITAFKTLNKTFPGLVRNLGKAGVAGAVLGLWTVLFKVVDAAQTASVSVEELGNRLTALKDGAAGVNALFSDIGQGWADNLSTLNFDVGADSAEDFRASLDLINDYSLLPDMGPIGDFSKMLRDIAGTDGGLRQFGIRVRQIGDELGTLASTDLPGAREQFNSLVEAAGGGEEVVAQLINQMPAYRDALYSAATAQGLTLDETSLLAAATGELALGVEVARASTEEATAAIEAQIPSLEDLISKQAEAAGVVLSERDAQRQLQASIDDATAAMETNGLTLDITTAAGRANQAALDGIADSAWLVIASMEANDATQAEMQASMQVSRDAFINMAIAEGMGADEANRLADEMGLIPTKVGVTVSVETAYAEARLAAFKRLLAIPDIVVTAHMRTQGGYYGGGLHGATGGPIPGYSPSPTADNIPIMATAREYMQPVVAHDYWGTGFMDAVRRMDKAAADGGGRG